ncbi:MAG: hypothetical protein AB9866_24190 [Syntrophobacteraceae bacterium]
MGKMKIMRHSLLLFILLAWTTQAFTEPFSIKNLPSAGKALADFVPTGWSVENQESGDLNGDEVSDIAAILVQGNPGSGQSESEEEPQRVLILLLGHDKEKYYLAGSNDAFLLCKGCGGVKEGVGISIRKGVVIIEQMSGSREYSNETFRFRYDPQTQRFILIGRDLETADAMLGTGTMASFNCLTGVRITETYRYDKKGERKIVTATKKEKGNRNTPFLEDVEPEN